MDDLDLTPASDWAPGYPERDDDVDVYCPRCGQPIDPTDFVCEACDAALPADQGVAAW